MKYTQWNYPGTQTHTHTLHSITHRIFTVPEHAGCTYMYVISDTRQIHTISILKQQLYTRYVLCMSESYYFCALCVGVFECKPPFRIVILFLSNMQIFKKKYRLSKAHCGGKSPKATKSIYMQLMLWYPIRSPPFVDCKLDEDATVDHGWDP